MTAAARPHRHRTLLAYAVAPVALAALGACTGSDPGPAVTTPPSTSAVTSSSAPTTTTTSATPSPTATVDPIIAKIPAAARPETIEGAAAYTKFYFTQLNRAFKTSDPSVLNDLSSDACKMCAALSNGVADLKKAGHHYGGDLTKLNYASTTEFSSRTRQVLVDLNQRAVPVLDESGRTVDTTRSAKLAFVATVDFDKRWIITRLQKASS
ncbi:DUF6318 family protein [Terrabacter sp. Soil811]|nr:DUF6318 family protein [Terrabacter sp. Soil811]